MRKFKILFCCLVMLIVVSSRAQDNQLFRNPDQGANRYAEMQCPLGSVFSQLPSWAGISWGINADRQVADDFTVSSPPLSMRFWGVNSIPWEDGVFCQPTEMTFIIRIYERNLSDPTLPGDEAASYTLTAVPLYGYTPNGFGFQIDVDFPEPVPIADGWVSLSCISDVSPCLTLWHGEDMGGTGLGNACAYMYDPDADEWFWLPAIPDFLEFSMAFCLYGPPPPVPITNWALVISIVFIGTFIVLRYRRA